MTKNHHFYQSPRKLATSVFCGAFAAGMMVSACNSAPVVTFAEEAGAAESIEPQTVYLSMVERTGAAEPVIFVRDYAAPVTHDLPKEEVELLAKLLWSSPLRDERQKKALCWVALNRIGVYPYGDSLTEVINRTEFTFYDRKAHISEVNERIATEALNAYYSIVKDHLNVQRPFSAGGVAIRFCGERNRYIKVLDASFTTVIWDGTEK